MGAISDMVNSRVNGAVHDGYFRKIPSQASVAGWWVDVMMAAGNPLPDYKVGNILEATSYVSLKGIFHGDVKTPQVMRLAEIELMTASAAFVGMYRLLDYLLFYPFVDGDSPDDQPTDNTVNTLTRYADGNGVQVMVVCTAPTSGGGSFNMDYINQDGVAKTSPTNFYTPTAAFISNIATSQPASVAGFGPFVNLANGDSGVRSITVVRNLVPNGGHVAFVLVKPLASLAIAEINTAMEVSFINQRTLPPRIYDGAYLGFIMNCAASVAAAIVVGRVTTTWSIET